MDAPTRAAARGVAQAARTDEHEILDLIHECVIAFDLDYRITFWNTAAEKLYGWIREEAVGRQFEEIFDWTHPTPLAEVEAELFATGSWHGEFPRRIKSGATIQVEVYWVVRRNDAGEPIEIIATSWDISERRRAEEELERSERRYRGVFNRMPCAFWEVESDAFPEVFEQLREEGVTSLVAYAEEHPDFASALHNAVRITDVNDEAVRLLGARDRSELIGPLANVWSDQRGFLEAADRLFRGAASYQRLSKIKTLDGREVDVIRTSIYIDDLSEAGSVMTGAIDVTEQVRALEELARSEAKYRNLFDHMPIGVFQTDTKALMEEFDRLRAEGVEDLDAYLDDHPDFIERSAAMVQITDVNAEAVALFGAKSADEMLGSVGRFFRANNEVWRRNLVARFSGMPSIAEEMRATRLDGQVLDVFYSSTFSDALNTMGIGLGGVIDISRRVAAEKKLRQVQAEFAHAARVATLGELAGSIAHEGNQPLTAIVANGEAGARWLAGPHPNVEEARKLMARMVLQARRAGDIIARIRGMASGKPPAYEPISLNYIFEEVLSLLWQEITARNVRLRQELAEGLPEVLADATQLKQVLVNLIVNALQAMDQSETVKPGLVLRTLNCGDHVRLEIDDNGPGISPDVAAHLFESFFTTKPEGLGIGLSICRSIIEAHGGTISCSPRKRGASFSFTLPVKAETPT